MDDFEMLLKENALLRKLLALRVAGAMLYTDDGELSDASSAPYIDFKRDSAEDIEKMLLERGRRVAQSRAFDTLPDDFETGDY